MLDVVLVAPQIAANTGNIIRLCANAGARLHLVRPLGFTLDERALRRAGLDYHELAETTVWDSWDECRAGLGGEREWYATTARPPHVRYDRAELQPDICVVFGCERDGLPATLLDEFPADRRIGIPMRPGNRSLNLANAVSVVVYDAWRRTNFSGAAGPSDDRGGFDEARSPLDR